MVNLRFAGWKLLAGAMALSASPAAAQNFPLRPIRIITVPIGGGADTVARLLALEIAAVIGRPIIIDNRPASLGAEILTKATPAAIISRLNQETVRVLGRAEIKERFLNTGSEAVGNSVAQFGAFLKSELAKWGNVLRGAGVKPEQFALKRIKLQARVPAKSQPMPQPTMA